VNSGVHLVQWVHCQGSRLTFVDMPRACARSGCETLLHKSRSAAGCVETGFARFVYCLGGREPQIVSPSVEPNAGAAQYWKLLHDALYGPSHPHSGLMRSGEPNAQRRLENKLSLLHGLRASGIWLEDASISALYRAGKRVTRRPSWDYYVSEVVRSSAPVAVIVIGEYVNRAIGDAVREDLGDEVHVVEQPNAWRSAAASFRFLSALKRCRTAAAISCRRCGPREKLELAPAGTAQSNGRVPASCNTHSMHFRVTVLPRL
jgi:hypothetical protein